MFILDNDGEKNSISYMKAWIKSKKWKAFQNGDVYPKKKCNFILNLKYT